MIFRHRIHALHILPTDDRTAVPNVRICHVVVTPVRTTIFLEIEYKGMRFEPFDQRRGDTSTSCIVRWRCTVTCEALQNQTDCDDVRLRLLRLGLGMLEQPRKNKRPRGR